MAAKKSVPVKLHKVIYKLIDDLKEELSSKLAPIIQEKVIGKFTLENMIMFWLDIWCRLCFFTHKSPAS